MRLFVVFACAFIAICANALPGRAESRVALVIGNSAYLHVQALPNPLNDADDVSESLERLGFAVRRVFDGTFDDMRQALQDFATEARQSEMAVIFYAGHGMEIGGENWLVPVDAELRIDIAADQEAVGLRRVLEIAGEASRLGLVILDACRENPFSARMQRSLPARAVERGLVRVEPAGTVLVVYAAREGTTANDGAGRNSPFTAALLRNIERPGLEINYLFRSVREEVFNGTDPHQEPVVYGALPRTEIYLKELAAKVEEARRPPVGPLTPQRSRKAAQAGSAVNDMTSDLARMRIDELKKETAAVASPPEQPAQPDLATLSVDDVLKAKGRWVSDFNIDFKASAPPKVFEHYFIYTREDDSFTAPGAIVTGMHWDPAKSSPLWRIVHGSLRDAPDNSWYIHGSFLTYLGPEWKPEFGPLSDAVFSRLNGKNLGKKINHETEAVVTPPPGQSAQSSLASVEEVLKAKGRWVSEFNVDSTVSRPPEVFEHYFIYLRTDSDYLAPGAIVTGSRWDKSVSPLWRVVHGTLREAPDNSWYSAFDNLAYLGPDWKPEFAGMSDAVFSRLNGRNLGKKIDHETAAVVSPPGQPARPRVATPSVDEVLKAKGRWISEFGVDSAASKPPKVFEHYFIYTREDDNYTAPGAIVSGNFWRSAGSSEWRIVHGTLKDISDNSWWMSGHDLTYLGPKWKPEFAQLSDAVFSRLNGRNLGKKIDHETAAVASPSGPPASSPEKPVQPGLATLSVDEVLKARGHWVSDFNVDFTAATPPRVFEHYFIYAAGANDTFTAAGSIVTGSFWDKSSSPKWRIIHGSLQETSDNSWFIHGDFLTYLGPEWKPEFARLSGDVLSRLKGKALGKKITHK
jgi:hypothetical protein